MQSADRSNCKVFSRLDWAFEGLVCLFSPFGSEDATYSSSAAHHLCLEIRGDLVFTWRSLPGLPRR